MGWFGLWALFIATDIAMLAVIFGVIALAQHLTR